MRDAGTISKDYEDEIIKEKLKTKPILNIEGITGK